MCQQEVRPYEALTAKCSVLLAFNFKTHKHEKLQSLLQSCHLQRGPVPRAIGGF